MAHRRRWCHLAATISSMRSNSASPLVELLNIGIQHLLILLAGFFRQDDGLVVQTVGDGGDGDQGVYCGRHRLGPCDVAPLARAESFFVGMTWVHRFEFGGCVFGGGG